MAGKPIDDAKNAQQIQNMNASSGGNRCEQGNCDTSKDHELLQKHTKYKLMGEAYIVSHGIEIPLPPSLAPSHVAPTAPPPSANFVNLYTDELLVDVEWGTFVTYKELQVSINWNEQINVIMMADRDMFVIYADTGANIHIFPHRSDFATLKPIEPRSIKGFQGSSINTVGVGSIITDKFMLHDVLYVPTAAIHLMSIIRICKANSLEFHFNSKGTWATDTAGHMICTGIAVPGHNLYQLDCALLPFTPTVASAAACGLHS
jgi:hypothetical protein